MEHGDVQLGAFRAHLGEIPDVHLGMALSWELLASSFVGQDSVGLNMGTGHMHGVLELTAVTPKVAVWLPPRTHCQGLWDECP